MRAASAGASALRARVEANPADIEAVMDLAVLEFTGGMIEAALKRMVDLVRASSGDERDRVRVRLLELLDTLAPDDPQALAARRDLAAALF